MQVLAARVRTSDEVVHWQVKQDFYDLDANLALLRFYQYSPATAKMPTISKVCCHQLFYNRSSFAVSTPRFSQSQAAQTAGKAVVKLTLQVWMAAQILMKALMEMPGTDFMLCMYLIPVTTQKDASIETLKTLADKLESCMFKQFWTEVSHRSII